ncbi:MAG: Gx transporter family protein [Lachnospiraceae bacterium]|nr:Gx transporter family protein [Lachnospiraceae bacterium]
MHEINVAHKTAYMGLLVALGLILSYVESLIPFFYGIPGMKLGLANLMVLITMDLLGNGPALLVNLLRIVLAGFLFGNLYSILYSLAGALLSFGVMVLLRKKDFGLMGISAAGGIFHNLGQLLVAMLVVETWNVGYYAPVLVLSGLVTGLLIGFISGLLLPYLRNVVQGIRKGSS